MKEAQLELVRAATGGDDDALARLLQDAGGTLRAELVSEIDARYRGVIEADDIIQVTCLEAFLRIHSFDASRAGAFFGWLRQIARNNLLDAIKELQREKRFPPDKRVARPVSEQSYFDLVQCATANAKTVSSIVRGEELRQGVDAALRSLPPDYEQVLRMYELEGLSGEEVAERMGRRPGAVRMLVARARTRLGEVLAASPQFASRA